MEGRLVSPYFPLQFGRHPTQPQQQRSKLFRRNSRGIDNRRVMMTTSFPSRVVDAEEDGAKADDDANKSDEMHWMMEEDAREED